MEILPEGMSIPNELLFKPSLQQLGKMGVWSKKQIPNGRLYGPFKGEKKRCHEIEQDTYSWEIVGPKGKRLFSIDASDPTKANWMRYVKTAADKTIHNLRPVQHKKKIYYRTCSTISIDSELLCWYEGADTPADQQGFSQMPVLERMATIVEDLESSGDSLTILRPEQLKVTLPENSDLIGLEPPLISPIYPMVNDAALPLTDHPLPLTDNPLSLTDNPLPLTDNPLPLTDNPLPLTDNPLGAQVFSANDLIGNNLLTLSSDLVNYHIEGGGVVSPAIQAPDISSTASEADRSQEEDAMQSPLQIGTEKDGVSSSTGKKHLLNKEKVALNPKGGKKWLGVSSSSDPPKLKDKNAILDDTLTEITPACILMMEDGGERYQCKKCSKICKYPIGLKMHYNKKHGCTNVKIVGIAKKPWAKGIPLADRPTKPEKRDGEKKVRKKCKMKIHGKKLQTNSKKCAKGEAEVDDKWKSLDCSVIQSALKKLKEACGVDAALKGRSSKVDNKKRSNCDFETEEIAEDLSRLSFEDSQTEDEGEKNVCLNLKNAKQRSVLRTEIAPTKEIVETCKRKNWYQSPPRTDIVKVVNSKDSSEQKKESSAPKKRVGSKKKAGFIFPKSFQCPLCSQAFAYKYWLDKHMLKHEEDEDKKFNCRFCSFRCSSTKELISHVVIHKDVCEVKQQWQSLPIQESENQCSSDKILAEIKTAQNVSDKFIKEEGAIEEETSSRLIPTVPSHPLVKKKLMPKKPTGAHSQKMLCKKYFCRLCGTSFTKPSNRSRHMRMIHGIVPKRKKNQNTVSSSSLESSKSLSTTEDEGHTASIFPLVSRSIPSVSPKETVKSTHKPSTSTSHGKHSEKHVRRRKRVRHVLVNRVIAHQKMDFLPSKITNYSTIRDRTHFPKTPGIVCPWDRVNVPQPYVPGLQNSVRREHTEINENETLPFKVKCEVNSVEEESEGYHGDDNNGVLDLSLKSARKQQSSIACDDQPLDLSRSASPAFDIKPIRVKEPNVKALSDPRNILKNFGVFGSKKRNLGDWKRFSKVDTKVPVFNSDIMMSRIRTVPWHFVCNICMAKFTGIRELNVHVIAHAEDFPFKCEFCMNLFESSRELSHHKLTKHSVKKMYSCSACQQDFAYLSNLEKHQLQEHVGQKSTFVEHYPDEVRPQNFTDPTKAFNMKPIVLQEKDRVSFFEMEMVKNTPPKLRQTASVSGVKSPAIKPKTRKETARKLSTEKNMLFNPQRNHPFEETRRIGYLSMLSDPRNQKQLGSPVSNHVCTKCLKEFKDVSLFHIHIMECAALSQSPKEEQKQTTMAVIVPTKEKEEIPKEHVTSVKPSISLEHNHSKMVSYKKSLEKAKKKRAKPGTNLYNPQKYARAKAARSIDDIHACAGCDKKFYFINQLERHMKLCPNREKLVNANKSNVALALRKRPRSVQTREQHRCSNCTKHFTYLGSLEKHLLWCTSKDATASGMPENNSSPDNIRKKSPPSTENKAKDDATTALYSESEKMDNVLGRGRRKKRRKTLDPYWTPGKKYKKV